MNNELHMFTKLWRSCDGGTSQQTFFLNAFYFNFPQSSPSGSFVIPDITHKSLSCLIFWINEFSVAVIKVQCSSSEDSNPLCLEPGHQPSQGAPCSSENLQSCTDLTILVQQVVSIFTPHNFPVVSFIVSLLANMFFLSTLSYKYKERKKKIHIFAWLRNALPFFFLILLPFFENGIS